MDTAKAAIHDLEAVETRQGAVRQAVCTGSEQRPGCQNRRESSRPMAHRQQPRSELRVPQCLLRYAWTSQVVHWSLTQSVRTAGCGPACPVVWQGRAGDRSPYADCSLQQRLESGAMKIFRRLRFVLFVAGV